MSKTINNDDVPYFQTRGATHGPSTVFQDRRMKKFNQMLARYHKAVLAMGENKAKTGEHGCANVANVTTEEMELRRFVRGLL